MYNADQKLRYINSLNVASQTERVKKSMFNKYEPLEYELGKDLCDINAEEVVNHICTFCDSTYSTFNRYFAEYFNYSKWALLEGVADISVDRNYSNDELRRAFKSTQNKDAITYRTPAELIESIELIFDEMDPYINESDYKDYISMYDVGKVYMMMIYSGIEPTDATKIKISDIKIDNDTLQINYLGDIINVPNEFRPCFEKIVNSNTCVNFSHFKYVTYDRADDYILNLTEKPCETQKDISNIKIKVQKHISHVCMEYNKEFKTDLSFKMNLIHLAGFVYKLKSSGVARDSGIIKAAKLAGNTPYIKDTAETYWDSWDN